jgi:hypothetical protein
MISVLFSLLIAALAAFAAIQNGLATPWIVLSTLGGYILGSLLIGLAVRRRLGAIQRELQDMMQAAQARMQRSVQQAQHKPGANPAALQKKIQLQQAEVIKQGLKHTEKLEPYRKWAPTLGRQIATMRLQFLYQLKRFEEVDEILAIRHPFRKPMLMEPTIVAMKMARAYKQGDMDAMEATFNKHIRWMRGDRGTLLYGLMSWAWLKKGEKDKAFELLAKGKDKTADETLARNWEHLANDRAKKFSNAGLGEEWYALHLEAPPKPKMQRARGRGGF